MHDFIRKLWNSKATISVILWIAVFVWIINPNPASKPIIKHTTTGKTVEEIIATNVDHSPELTWDTEFRSSVEAVK